MVLLDTNIFLEVFLNQEKEINALPYCTKLKKAKLMHSLLIPPFIQLEQSSTPWAGGNLLPTIFASLSAFKALTLIQTNLEEQAEIATLINRGEVDFDDAYQVYFARRYNVPIVSFDKHLDKFLIRKIPEEVIQP